MHISLDHTAETQSDTLATNSLKSNSIVKEKDLHSGRQRSSSAGITVQFCNNSTLTLRVVQLSDTVYTTEFHL